MAGSATIAIEIVSDASRATAGLDHTADAVDRVGREAKTAGDRIEHMGSKSGQTTSGLRDMADAVSMLGFPGLSTAMTTAAVGFEAIDGAATLFGAHSKILTKVLGGVTKAMNFLKVSILTNPIFIIAAIIIAIGVAFVILYKKCDGFRRIVDAVFRVVKSVMLGLWNWIRTAFAAVFDFLAKPFKMWLAIAKAVFGAAKAFVTGYINFVKSAFSKVFDAITAPFRKAMDWIKSHVKFPSLPSWLPGVGKSATGAVFMPTARGAAPRAVATGVGPTFVINAGIGDPHEIARQIRRVLRDDSARLGRLPAWSGAL